MTVDSELKIKGMLQQTRIPAALPLGRYPSVLYPGDQSLPVSPCLSTSPLGQSYMYEEIVPTTIIQVKDEPGMTSSQPSDKLTTLDLTDLLDSNVDRSTIWPSPTTLLSSHQDVRAEEVMMSDSRYLPTLAQLNNSDNLSVLDDINSVIIQDLQSSPDGPVMYGDSAWPEYPGVSTNATPSSSDIQFYGPKRLDEAESLLSLSPVIIQPLTEPKLKVEGGSCSHTRNTPMLQKLLSSPVKVTMPVTPRDVCHRPHTESLDASDVNSIDSVMAVIPQHGCVHSSEDEEGWKGHVASLENQTIPTRRPVESEEDTGRRESILSPGVDDIYETGQADASIDDFMNDSSDGEMDFSDADDESMSSFAEEMLADIRKEKNFFWQYNTQSKGPKGKRLVRGLDATDPHVLGNFEDPVFDPEAQEVKYKHGGRVRRGDGNDVTPNPYKLFQIGNHLKKLNKRIFDITHPDKTCGLGKGKTRREKNKFASRACRLKKKAQHEANKVKLYGLNREHGELMIVLDKIKSVIRNHLDSKKNCDESMTNTLETLMKTHLTEMIADNTADYVNSVLEKIARGDKSGGILPKKMKENI